jgi:hypothetical protein
MGDAGMKKALVLLIIVLFTNACSGKWFHPVKGEAEFNADKEECVTTARNVGLAASYYGQRVELNAYNKALSSCLHQKGWSTTPVTVETRKKLVSGPLSARLNDTTFLFGKKEIVLPQGARMLRQSVSSYGSLVTETLEIEGVFKEISFAGRILFQQSFGPEDFEKLSYPVTKPFFLYSFPGAPPGLSWRSFAGELDGSWYGGIGAYWRISQKLRAILIVTTSLPPKEQPYASTARISFAQTEAMDRFLEMTSPWFETMGVKKGMSHFFKSERLRLEFGD